MSGGRSRRLRVGVTGGIGSGKTAVTDRLAAHGIRIVDADVVAREVVAPGTEALAAIAEHFGNEIIAGDGSLNRSALREIVFAQPAQRRWLESLTHPLIRERIAMYLDAADSAYVVLSSPLLIESGQVDFVDHVVVVDIPETLQLSRTMQRDGNTPELVQSIMQAQCDRKTRLAAADTVIDNSGTLEELTEQVSRLHTQLLALAGARSADA